MDPSVYIYFSKYIVLTFQTQMSTEVYKCMQVLPATSHGKEDHPAARCMRRTSTTRQSIIHVLIGPDGNRIKVRAIVTQGIRLGPETKQLQARLQREHQLFEEVVQAKEAIPLDELLIPGLQPTTSVGRSFTILRPVTEPRP